MIYSINEIDKIAEKILQTARNNIFILSGNLGAGKTTLVKAIAKKLEIPAEIVSSPTFNIVNIYESQTHKIYHLDLYRLKNPAELYDIGFEEILDEAVSSPSIFVFIEWAEIAEDFLPYATKIELKILDYTTREIIIEEI